MERLDVEFFKLLPEKIQKEVVSDLAVYNTTILMRENGRIFCCPHSWIVKEYPKDHKVYGEFHYDDFKDMPEVIEGRKEYEESLKYVDERFWD